jgi:hypothetical protein
MKKYTLYLSVLALIVLAALWLRHTSGENAALQAAIATQRAGNAPPPDDRAAMVALNKARSLMENNAALQAELRRIEEATRQIESDTAALQLKLPPSLDAEVTESYGRISDMGAEFGQYFRLISGNFDEMEQELRRRGLNEESDLSESVVRAFGKFTTWAPEIGAMEDTPAEIGSLQAAALRAIFSLDVSLTQQAEAIIETHFATMKAAGLTYSSQEVSDWRERRSESLTQLLWKLRPLIPANSKLTPNLTQIVNLGAGIETKTIAPEPGTTEPQMVQSFPNWPAVPWLP